MRLRVSPQIASANLSFFLCSKAGLIGEEVENPLSPKQPDCTLIDFGNARFWIPDRFLEDVEE